jgi:hypothetical protein
MRNNKLNDATRIFIHTAMFQEGIVPMEDPTMDVRRALKGLQQEDARRLKRKFRKLWRKQMKKQLVKLPEERKKLVKNKYVAVPKKGKPTRPSRRQRLARKQAVYDEVMKTKVEPMVKQLKTIKREEESSDGKKEG